MNDIKFRAWDTFNGEYIYSDRCAEFPIFWASVQRRINGGNRVDIEQYTGLKDRNGTEAYINDLFIAKSDHLYTAVFEQGAFGYHGPIGGDFVPMKHLIDNNIEFEIIGNIHENPELR